MVSHRVTEYPALSQQHGLPPTISSVTHRISHVHGVDITTMKVDAIVNAANEKLIGGSGVDGAIHSAAGSALYRECLKLGGASAGQAKITGAGNLPCKKVIHAVGPRYNMMDADRAEFLLRKTYVESLRVARENGCKTVAFPCMGTGVFRYPKEDAARVAAEAVKSVLSNDETEDGGYFFERILFLTLKDNEGIYEKVLPEVFPELDIKQN